jgi:hypothetical protein
LLPICPLHIFPQGVLILPPLLESKATFSSWDLSRLSSADRIRPPRPGSTGYSFSDYHPFTLSKYAHEASWHCIFPQNPAPFLDPEIWDSYPVLAALFAHFIGPSFGNGHSIACSICAHEAY